MVGKTISHYKIIEKLGEGGMGVVYKAEDTKLERTVALKFLSLASIGDEEKKRFKREAKAAASLNHPNIATIFAIDEAKPAAAEAGDQTFIAMEYIEGQSLQEIVGANGGKPMPMDKAIDYATQIAAGLQAAHEKGITHRDIKSANIMVTDKGQIKIMDFGLAKLANRSKLTQLGTTLGTAAYMSPEQSRGENTDHRADIWSLGVVLYEMISGQMPFKGDYEQAVIYSIQNEEPEPLTALRTGVPIALDGIIAKALAKDASTRYQNVEELPADLRALDTAALSKSRISKKQPVSASNSQSALQSKFPWIVAILMTVIAAVALVRLMQTVPGTSPQQNVVKRAHLILPEGAPLELIGAAPFAAGQTALTLSADGRHLVYVAKHNGSTRLFLRPLDRFEATPLPGTDGAYYPFFSPDGKWVGFFADNAMKKVAIDGGEPVEICEVTHPYGATWASNGHIFFSNSEGNELMRVSAAGGKPQRISEHSPSEVSSYYWPSIMPGQIKIMDFGLAKLANRSKLTQLGTTLGTAAYMSPEQSRGENTDHRADIWSLGVVLYEMISGQMPFKGDYEQAVIYSIQNEEPEPLTALRTGVPIALDGIIAKALAKDISTRYQNVEELPADLKAIDTASLSRSRISTKQTGFATHFQSAWQMKMPWLVAGLMTLLAAIGFWYGWLANSGDMPSTGVKRAILPLNLSDGMDGGFALSPDGRMLVFVGRSEARSQLFLRHLNKDETVALAGTEDGGSPFFSPDGKWIGFRTDTKLKKVSVEGRSPIEICDAFVQAASWGAKDQIVFSKRFSDKPWELMRVPAQGGLPEPLPADESETGGRVRSPQILPDGRHVLFTSVPNSVELADASIVVQSLESGERRTLIRGGMNPRYLPTGHIIFIRFSPFRSTLMAVPFDLESLTITGPDSPLSEDVTSTDGRFFTVSMDGTLIYRSGDQNQVTGLAWVDRQGRTTAVSAPAHVYWDPRLSPDGQRVAVNSRDSGTEIWVYELTRSTLTRLTFNSGNDETPFWSPDGRWIAFASKMADQPQAVFRKLADGSAASELLWTNGHHVHVECWSADGRSIIVTDNDPNTLEDIWLLNLGDEISARPLLQTQFGELGGRISPDGRWLAYTSDESGRREIYVRAFPEMDNKVQVSADGGSQPVWAANGKELFYRGEGQLMAGTVTPGETFILTSPRPLFTDLYPNPAVNHTSYDVARDGQRFLMLQGDAKGLTNLNVVFNWFEEVKRLAAGGK